MTRVRRLGAVDYLNARPLVYGLERQTHLFSVRFDVPSRCAALLHEGSIDAGMIPSIAGAPCCPPIAWCGIHTAATNPYGFTISAG